MEIKVGDLVWFNEDKFYPGELGIYMGYLVNDVSGYKGHRIHWFSDGGTSHEEHTSLIMFRQAWLDRVK
jgi:hypothetical protein